MSLRQSDPGRIRRGLIRYLTEKLDPIYPAGLQPATFEAWTAGLGEGALVEALRQDPEEIAERLAQALTVEAVMPDAEAAILDIIAAEFRLSIAAAGELAAFTRTLRRLATEGDGIVTAGALYAEGYPSAQAAALMPNAKRVLAILAGETDRRPSARRSPADRLAAAGERAAAILSTREVRA